MRFENITKKYGEKTVLQDFSLEIAEGKITCILGESGSGKTTLLNVAARLTPFSGNADFRSVSYIFQDARLLPNLTVEQNLQFVLPKSLWGNIPATLEKIGLAGKETAYPLRLSGGEAKRVAIARAFLYPHEVLLMDEPFSSLDVRIKKDLMELFFSLWQEKRNTVLFVTHDVHEAALLAHRAVVLQSGKIVFDQTLSDPLPRDYFTRLPVETELTNALFLPKLPK